MNDAVRLFVGLAVVAAVAQPLSLRADDTTDLYFQEAMQRYFEYPQNARTFGMAGSSVPTSIDSSSVIGNPAGMGLMRDGEVSATYSYNRISGDEFPTGVSVDQVENDGSAMFAMPLGPRHDSLAEFGNFGMAWAYRNGNWHDDTYDTDTEATRVTAAYAYPLSSNLSVGYSLGWVDDRFQSKAVFDYPMGNGFRHTLGAIMKEKDLIVGLSLIAGHGTHHALYGPGTEVHSQTNAFGIDAGVEFAVAPQTKLAFAADYRHLSSDGGVESSIPQNVVGGAENGNTFDARVGVEQTLNEEIKLRAGYRYAGLARYKYNRVELNDLNGSAYYNAFTLGAGYRFPFDSGYIRSLNLDYGVEYRVVGDNDWQHVVTLSIPFNACGVS
ncbi:MAG: outer membrane beta-barrel protein [Deltaproteobacteria bacterium]|nr:outer membrane beta-barrel protein [Deltaproteobacteria bacterium]